MENPSFVIDRLGGTNAVARRTGVKPPSVTGWRTNGIPDDKLLLLAVDIERKIGVRRWALRPGDWHLIWPELIGSEGAPALPSQQEVRDAA